MDDRTVRVALEREGLVTNETQYFADRFDHVPSRAHLVAGQTSSSTTIKGDQP